jgi:LacI family transcriptional regulator
VAIVGFDDIDHAQLAAVPLTTIRQPMYEIGHRAAELILAEAAAGQLPTTQVLYSPTLVVRASTGAAPRVGAVRTGSTF